MTKGKSLLWLKIIEILLLIISLGVAFFLLLAGTEQYWRKPDIEAKMQNASQIDPSDSVVLSFNQSVDRFRIEQGLKIFPPADVKLQWKKENSELEISPADYFQPGTKYRFEFPVLQGIFGIRTQVLGFEYTARDFPKVDFAVPGKEEKDISIDSDFKITFDQSARNFDISFEVSPEKGFRWESDAEKRTFRVFPNGKLDYETAYAVRVTARPVSNGSPARSREIFSGTFQTEKKPVPAAVSSHSPEIPIEEVVDLAARITEGKYIDINLAKQHLSIFENSERLGTYRISSGKRGMATPTGSFKILSKNGRAWSNKYKLYMPYWMQFTGVGHGIHELPEWPGGYKEGAAHLGTPVSHGCVRLGIGPAQTVYNWADKGTPVVIHY